MNVTDADRKAAAKLNGYGSWAVWEICPQHSEEWMLLCANDFARHRELGIEQGKAIGRREALEEAAKVLDGLANEAMYEREYTALEAAVKRLRALIGETT